ncbi:hypothetical protein KY290_016647 [Solanum tuberosum]|uniref:Uncharacterized protein n=1 Tax=Solanum tuberosum TaxID=4113 RepID=A0ABQ7V935_SOLTU|nr:hypothetical protein KY284_015925 [Solanum tuberosum]KAH0760574.1 hypothetical protein KY290_016647 [Solanum tuberosum]
MIGSIQALNGDRLQDPKDIQTEIISFYQSLMGASQKNLSAVDRKVIKQGPGLAHHQQLKLCEEVND